jgi:hypothetical protein
MGDSIRLPGKKLWIYKCKQEDKGYSWCQTEDGFLAMPPALHSQPFGGGEWISAPFAHKNLARVIPGDLVLCYQEEEHAIVGITVADSYGYRRAAGDSPDTCTGLNLGPDKVRFNVPIDITDLKVTVAQSQQHAAPQALSGFAQGSQPTFHQVEEELKQTVFDYCCECNSVQRAEIWRLVKSAKRRAEKCNA